MNGDLSEKIEDFLRQFTDETNQKKYLGLIKNFSFEKSNSLTIDYRDLSTFNPKLAQNLIDEPEKLIKEIETTIEYILHDEFKDPQIININARFTNLPEKHKIKLDKIHAASIGKLVLVQGLLIQKCLPKMFPIQAAFKCELCQSRFMIPQDILNFQQLKLCLNNNCHITGHIKFLASESQYISIQRIKVQKPPQFVSIGQIPSSLEVILNNDLISLNLANLGDCISVIGILKVIKDKSNHFHHFLIANNIELLDEDKYLDYSELKSDEKKIKDLAKDPNIHRRIIDSIVPSILNYEIIKEIIAAFLFGIEKTEFTEGNTIRSNFNILLIIDLDTLKNQFLKAIKRISPNSIYIRGEGLKKDELIGRVIKESGEICYEAGALIIADKKILCFEDLDMLKGRSTRSAIHEVLEERTVRLGKRQTDAIFNARTSIFATARPNFGRYDEYKTVLENIKNLPLLLLTHFDFVLIIKETQNTKTDMNIAEHILESQEERLESKDIIPPDLLNKYIRYARNNTNPVLQTEAQNLLKEFYLQKRSQLDDLDFFISPRQLETLVRLSKAYTRMALRNEVTLEDAKKALKVFNHSLNQLGYDEWTTSIDIQSQMENKMINHKSRMQLTQQIVRELANNKGNLLHTRDIIDFAASLGLDEKFILKGLEDLKNNGIIFRPYKDHWKFV